MFDKKRKASEFEYKPKNGIIRVADFMNSRQPISDMKTNIAAFSF